MKLSEIVRRYREEHGLSIRQFAKQCDISHSSSHIKMPQADRTWGAAGGGTPPTPGGEGAKRPETVCYIMIESDRFYK